MWKKSGAEMDQKKTETREAEKERQKVEESLMSSIKCLPPGFSAQISSIRRSNEDRETDEEKMEIPFEDSSDKNNDESQRIFTILSIMSDKTPQQEEEDTLEYHLTPPAKWTLEYRTTPPSLPESQPPLEMDNESSDK